MQKTTFYIIEIKGIRFKVGYRMMRLSHTEVLDEVELQPKQLEWFHQWVPKALTSLHTEIKELKNRAPVKMQLIEEDLSFDRFWNLYDYKQGSKDRAKGIWERLDDTERATIISKLKAIKFYYAANPNIARPHASTFLNQRRWENDYQV